MKRTLITSALPYANGHLHLGHAAGAYLPADIYARHIRLAGVETLYVCGSDEHGVAITISAEKEKVTPKDIIDKYHEANREAFVKFGMSFDIYSRTSLPEHHETAREFFADLLKKGFLVEREEEQFYDPTANMFLPDRYVEGVCPNCGYDSARGDQCDKCGAYYNQLELKNPKSVVTGNTPIVKKTTHWYMQFGKFQEFLEKFIESHSGDWKENVLQQSRSWLKAGLTDRAITRDLSWGVQIDGIEGLDKEKTNGKALYVWFEAVLGYISATKIWAKERGAEEDWKKWWQDEGSRYIAFIGKDNIVFHTLIFPALLKAKGGFNMPENVPANEFLNLEGQKFSKSRNWSIDLRDFLNDFPEERHVDALRYSLAMSFPETRDSDFAWKEFQARNNNELAAIFGNLVNRSLQFAHKNFDGKVPSLPDKYKSLPGDWKALVELFESDVKKYINDMGELPERFSKYSANDLQLIWSLWRGATLAKELYGKYKFRDAILETMNIARAANKYFNDEAPWKSIKADEEECRKTLYACCNVVNSLAIYFAPVTPFAAKKIRAIFDLEPIAGESNGARAGKDYWTLGMYPTIEEGSSINAPEIIFSKIEDDVIAAQIAKLGANSGTEPKKEELITIDDFMKVKLRTAKVLECEPVKKSDKLLKLQVDVGGEKRQILAGVAKYYKPEDLVGKTIVVVANLAPAKLMGEMSQGMMLAASTQDGKLCFVAPSDDSVGAGAEVR